jgi:hypothetical protein
MLTKEWLNRGKFSISVPDKYGCGCISSQKQLKANWLAQPRQGQPPGANTSTVYHEGNTTSTFVKTDLESKMLRNIDTKGVEWYHFSRDTCYFWPSPLILRSCLRKSFNAISSKGVFGTALLHVFQLRSIFFSQTVSALRTQFERKWWSCEST